MANRKQHEHEHDDYADTEVLLTHLSPDGVEVLDDAAAEAHGRYEEYVRFLDELPVLVEVVSEPPHGEKKRAKRVKRLARSKS
jgi:hypothetical protein